MIRGASLIFVMILLSAGVVLSGCGIQQKKQRSGLQIETGNNKTVAVYLNGTYINHTPLVEKSLQPGTYVLRLVPTDPSQVTYEESINLNPGTVTWMIWNPGPTAETSGGTLLEVEPLNPKKHWWEFYKSEEKMGSLIFQSIPDNAIVSIDSEREVRFAPSEYTDYGQKPISFTITLPSYETQAHTIEMKPGFQVKVISKLAKKDPLLASNLSESNVLGSTDVVIDPEATATSESSVQIAPTKFIFEGREVLRVRAEPSPTAPTIDYVDVGSIYPTTGNRETDWVEIQLASRSGWISSAYTTKVASSSATTN